MAVDARGVELHPGDVVQIIMDANAGTWRERSIGVVIDLDDESDHHVWFSGRVRWDTQGRADWADTTPLRVAAALLFQIAADAADDAMDIFLATNPHHPTPDRLAALRAVDATAADMWDHCPKPPAI